MSRSSRSSDGYRCEGTTVKQGNRKVSTHLSADRAKQEAEALNKGKKEGGA